ncbi:YycH family regulatory protein [Cohnella sp. WQ 127256]|uniref:YycH family regulatory protein n=1 Tax=Cohnella sp. WQ 127256 TaxID=2938790 RepID=UPI00211963EA|nr:two-component system activity regulator YycH [Cohnella sp. WQ 127256]
MIEKGKSFILFLLVAVSLVQSYFLAYSKPFMETKEKTELNYVKTELLGTEEEAKNLIFPEQLVLHLGNDKHTVFYPSTGPFYDLILTKLKSRVFKGMQRAPVNTVDWNQIRRENQGIELRFGRPIPFELLQRGEIQIDSDFLFFGDSIDRIWIYTSKVRDEVRTFFFSSDGRFVYEAQRADLTIGDVEGYVGFGQYWDPYTTQDGNLYIPEKSSSRIVEMDVAFDRYTTEQMQDNLFFDPGITKTIQNSKSAQFYTDGKRGLKVEQDGTWLSFTDLVARTEGRNDMMDNVMAAISFVNEHGGWNGRHQFVKETTSETGSLNVRFQQYYRDVPIVSDSLMNFGFIQLTMQQGGVSSYNRSLVVLDKDISNKRSRQLPGGDILRSTLKEMASSGKNVEALFPALRPVLKKDTITLSPVWAARLASGEVVIVADSSPVIAN